MTFEIRPIAGGDRPLLRSCAEEHWGADRIVSRGRVWPVADLEGLIARGPGDTVGFALVRFEGTEAELVLLLAVPPRLGLGTALIEALAARLRADGLERLWLITTNDNLDALRFYQRRGFALVAVHRRALERSRALKPSIPLVGLHGIPLRDEIELELRLRGGKDG